MQAKRKGKSGDRLLPLSLLKGTKSYPITIFSGLVSSRFGI
jgi:hypothetical protein